MLVTALCVNGLVILFYRYFIASPLFSEKWSVVVGLIVLLTLIMVGTHVLIRRILRPIRWLARGVNRIADGDLNYRMPAGRRDELGRLMEAFNDMTQRIREMLEARDRLLLDVSHELRSPLSRMRLALEFIPDGEKKQGLEFDLNEMDGMITEILESERMKNGNGQLSLEKHNIVAIIDGIVKEMEDRKPGFVLDVLPKRVMLYIDSARIKRVLRNLLDNSVKYGLDDSKPVEISLYRHEDKVKILIKDDGRGIPEEDLSQIFEPFYRVDRSRSRRSGGYGLGLSLCKRIMEAHGGCIDIATNETRGITVILTFPANA